MDPRRDEERFALFVGGATGFGVAIGTTIGLLSDNAFLWIGIGGWMGAGIGAPVYAALSNRGDGGDG